MSLPRTCLGFGLTAAAAAMILRPADAQTLPADAQPTCVFTRAAFAAMFVSRTVTLNGAVKPADSTVNLDPDGPCSFFQWGDQMYMWLTSPAAGGRPTFLSSGFYTVSPIDPATGMRSFVSNDPSAPVPMGIRVRKPKEMTKLLRASTGHVVEVAPPAAGAAVASAPLDVRLRKGGTARVASVRKGRSGALRFFDARGRELQVRTAVLPKLPGPRTVVAGGRKMPVVATAEHGNVVRARRFVVGGTPVFLDRKGDVIVMAQSDTEEGQADGGVLISQNLASPGQPGSLIYYLITVNDAYAYHRTMQPQRGIINDPNDIVFPTSAADMVPVRNFAKANGGTVANLNTLTMETKSSWVEASTIPVQNRQDYIQVQAQVPVFDTSSKSGVWTQIPGQTRTVTLAMVGLHVVGSTAGHPEMVWASFEHFGNAPNVAYSYITPAGVKTVPQDSTAGPWLFTPPGWTGSYNGMNNQWTAATTTAPGFIFSTSGSSIVGSPVMRMAPFGSLPGSASASTNTSVLSLNDSRNGLLAAGDIRRNYFQLGAVWTVGGAAPNSYNSPPTNLAGTTLLANTTMETFEQGATNGAGSCFGCHAQKNTTAPATVSVSHVYGVLSPLF